MCVCVCVCVCVPLYTRIQFVLYALMCLNSSLWCKQVFGANPVLVTLIHSHFA